MRTGTLIIFAFAVTLVAPLVAGAQETPKVEFAAGYNYFRANIVPSCACFSGHGGSASFTANANRWFGITGEIGVVRAGNVQSSGRGVTLLTYQAGPRFSIRKHDRATPYFHALFGGARASGSLYDVPLPGRAGTGPDSSWALALGGGLDVNLTPRVAFRAFQVDWVHTRLHNGSNDLQNSLRVTTGLVFRFGSR